MMNMFVCLVVGNSISLVDVRLKIGSNINIGDTESSPIDPESINSAAWIFGKNLIDWGSINP